MEAYCHINFQTWYFALKLIGFEGVKKRWTKNVNIFTKKFVFYPICENDHWFLAIQNNYNQQLTIFEPYRPMQDVVYKPSLRKHSANLRNLKNIKLSKIVQEHEARLLLLKDKFIYRLTEKSWYLSTNSSWYSSPKQWLWLWNFLAGIYEVYYIGETF